MGSSEFISNGLQALGGFLSGLLGQFGVLLNDVITFIQGVL